MQFRGSVSDKIGILRIGNLPKVVPTPSFPPTLAGEKCEIAPTRFMKRAALITIWTTTTLKRSDGWFRTLHIK